MPTKSDGIETLGLSSRINNALRAKGITEVGQLASVTPRDILMMKNLGKKTLQELEEALHKRGLALAQESEEEAKHRAARGARVLENLRLKAEVAKLRQKNAELQKRLRGQAATVRSKPRGKPKK